jgi:hypothetical protein
MGISYNPSIVTEGLVLALDPQNTRSYVGSGTTWTDLTNSANSGTLTNGPVFIPGGPFNNSGGSVSFDGSGDALQIPNTTDTNFGTGDFTIEAWIKTGSTASPAVIIQDYGSPGSANGWIFRQDATNNNKLELIVFDGSDSNGYKVTGTSIITDNEWHHVAATREGTTIKVFVDGVQEASATNSFNITSTQDAYIGMHYNGAYPFDGYISNLRIIKGTALYTSNFTPPTGPLEAIDDTVLLTCQGGAITDNGPSSHAITVNNDAKAVTASAFEFDGTNDYIDNTSNYLISSTTSTFTIESWIYMTAAPTNDSLNLSALISVNSGGGVSTTNYMSFGPISNQKLRLRWYDGSSKHAEGSTTLALNTWYHVVASVSSNAIKMFVNGVQETLSGTTTLTNRSGDAAGFALGQSYTYANYSGYISNVRVYKGKGLTAAEVQQNFNALRGRYGI